MQDEEEESEFEEEMEIYPVHMNHYFLNLIKIQMSDRK